MILTTPFPTRYGPGGQFLRVSQAWAPMGPVAAKRYSQSHEPGNPGFSLTTGLRGLGMYSGNWPVTGVPGNRGLGEYETWAMSGIYGQGTGLDGLYSTGMGDLSGDGSGLFGTGLFGNNWSWPEWAVIGIGVYLAIATFGGSGQARRKEMQKARLDYEARVAAIRDKYPRLPHPKSIFG
jgi:hypothetical protein